MKAYVGVTDWDWFRFLRDLGPDEVNFWLPSAHRGFKALDPAEPLLFKLPGSTNLIVGGGFYQGFVRMPVSRAWQAFAHKNGAASQTRMRSEIARHRKQPPHVFEDFEIGCVLLTKPFFFAEADWITAPVELGVFCGPGKSIDIGIGVGRTLWDQVQARLRDRGGATRQAAVGEGTFELLVTEAYHRRCAVTRQPILPTLEAVHIKPLELGGENRVNNGLLLRADIHRLFDQGYATVTPGHVFSVSRRIRDEFANGEEYFALDGRLVTTPDRIGDRPEPELLAWHLNSVYRA